MHDTVCFDTVMKITIDILQLITGLLLIATIMLQSKGAGLGAAFSSGDTIQTTRRGAEKGIFNISIVLSAIFIGLALARMFVL